MNESIESIPLKNPESTTLPDPEIPFRIRSFVVQNHMIYKEIKDKEKNIKEKYPIGYLIWIDKIKRSHETGLVKFEILFYYREQYHRTVVSRELFNEKNIQVLTKLGADVQKYKEIVAFLQAQERQVKEMENTHSSLGWSQQEDDYTFYHYKSIGPQNTADDITSTYVGNFDIAPKGSIEGWVRVIEDEILQKIPMEFALTVGFSAVVNGLIGKYRSMEVLLIHIYGESSMGKTTASRVAVSAFGKPGIGGLLENWNSTNNALMKTIGANHGVPIVLDEASAKNNTDFTAILYQLAEGREKRRLNSDIEMREQATWSGTIISTAEHKLTEKANKNSGLVVRVPEFGNKAWTESAQHAQAIKKGFDENYGIAGPIFVRYVMENNNKETLLNAYDSWCKKVLDSMTKKDNFSERLAEKYAMIMLTSELLNQCFEFELDLKGILKFIIDNDQETINGRTLDAKAIEVIQQQILTHQGKFNNGRHSFSGTECYGTIRKKGKYLEIAIVKQILDKWLEDAKFSSIQVAIKALKKAKILDFEEGKNTRTRKIPMTKAENEEDKDLLTKKTQTVYVLKMPLDLLQIVEEVQILKPKPKLRSSLKTNLISRKTIDDLLEEDDDEF